MKKKLLIAFLAITAALCCTFGFAACGGGINGKYYQLNRNGEIDKKTYFILKSGKWEDEDGESGDYKLNGDKITFYYTFFGETEELCDGTIKDYVLIVNGDTYVSENHRHNYGEWETVIGASPSKDGLRTRTCACGVKETEAIPATITEGLKYKLIENNKAYSVSGIGTAKDVEIGIPKLYNGLPVTSIADGAFERCRVFTSITIPDRASIHDLHPASNSGIF